MSTQFNAFGYTIFEPMTAFTDFILAALCLFFFYKTYQSAHLAVKGWSKFFLYMSLSTFIGGLVHAFLQDHTAMAYQFFWLFMQVLSGLSLMHAGIATTQQLPVANWFNRITVQQPEKFFKVQFFVFTGLVLLFQNFLVVVINSTIGFLIILALQLHHSKHHQSKASQSIATGIIISFLTAFVFISKLSISEWFNFKDLSHLIMMVSVYYIYQGTMLNQRNRVEELITH